VSRRTLAFLGTALFLLAAPGTVAGLIPWWITGWRSPAFGGLQIAGGLLTIGAACGVIECFARFARKGIGTPAPSFPTQHLVVSGLYRFVRNPMYVAVVSAILGQALLFESPVLAAYGALVWVLFHAFVLFYEEPTLRRSFGGAYDSFRENVPRWIPRVKPWNEISRPR
jgi:protein-S-isoprenylcysteine O-methyltransferase Ste14